MIRYYTGKLPVQLLARMWCTALTRPKQLPVVHTGGTHVDLCSKQLWKTQGVSVWTRSQLGKGEKENTM